ncbi:DUF4245 domain-containing protein [Leucobacter weissii]|uniref:DUF4245 domain-containing protein n=1 Tax=Leucobacter weissii TaxID=1983706 RepID=A0A939MKW9_9MICO|nr:DUF4245 family protein [Leucobacter weissii]MBO1900707.1 DUF4245 domain-containing protein [Leucobacter weissii]
MTGTQRPPVVVAELGRPETPAETAARKAENSRLYRQRKTVNNLVFSLIVTVALSIVIVLVVPRGTDTWSRHAVDVPAAASAAAASASRTLVAPEVPEGWLAKQAEVRSAPSGDIRYWYIGYTTANGAYAAVVQAFTETAAPVDDTWIAQQLEAQTPTGAERIGGLDWTVYDHPERNPDEANMIFGLETRVGDEAVLVYGTDAPGELRALAAEVSDRLDASAPAGADEAEAEAEETP